MQSGIPGVASTYGVSKDGAPYEPADTAVPSESVWSTPHYLRHLPRMLAAVREAHGEELDLLHDVHHRLTPNEAARLGRDVEEFRLWWLEDPVPAELQEGFRHLRRHTTTPIAVGEVFNTHLGLPAASHRAAHRLRPDVRHATPAASPTCAGSSSLADLHSVRTGSHGATDLSPVAMAAALHVDVSVPNFGIQEHMPHTALTDEVFPHSLHVLRRDDGPGRRARARRRARRGARRPSPVPAGLAAGQPAGRRDGAQLVTGVCGRYPRPTSGPAGPAQRTEVRR